MNDLRCYVCGKPIDSWFRLVSMSENVDRVFVVSEKCFPLVEGDAMVAIKVKRV